jgi:chemotaxis protein CheY-P-specific phosphatase CheC
LIVDEFPKSEIDRLAELAQAGAVQAAEAFAQLVGQRVETSDPIVLGARGPVSDAAESMEGADPGATGVFFEFEGCLDAIIGILFPGEASEMMVRRIVGIESGELEPPIVESALMEVGNILASHVASAIADRLDSRLLPSIPSLAMANAEVELDAFVDRVVGGDALRIESRLSNEAGRTIGRLVLIPTS